MYVTSANNAWALDARTGRIIWHHERPVSTGLLDDAAAHHNRGVGVWKNFVYMETDDAHLLCLDAHTGHLLWDVTYADKAKQYGATSAPLIVKDEVIVGTSGGDSGVRGFLAAYDAATGNFKWRFWTIPAPGEFGSSSWPGDSYLHGGGTTWMPGTYDPKLDARTNVGARRGRYSPRQHGAAGGVNRFRPVQLLNKRSRLDELSVGPVENIEKPVTVGLHQQVTSLAVHFGSH